MMGGTALSAKLGVQRRLELADEFLLDGIAVRLRMNDPCMHMRGAKALCWLPLLVCCRAISEARRLPDVQGAPYSVDDASENVDAGDIVPVRILGAYIERVSAPGHLLRGRVVAHGLCCCVVEDLLHQHLALLAELVEDVFFLNGQFVYPGDEPLTYEWRHRNDQVLQGR